MFFASTSMVIMADSAGLHLGSGDYMYQSYLDVRPTVPHGLIRCEYCRVRNDWDAHFCEACGAPLPDN